LENAPRKQSAFVPLPDTEDTECLHGGQLRGQLILGMGFASQNAMFAILCILGTLWLVGAALFVFALASAGRKPMPSSENEAAVLKRAA
jgi:hypothetical protein